ncbi:hypothetical protein ACFQH2_04340 [Natronoarchaeum sp. GCM10025703]|uniref:hypothetical protein n=1 Tax=Natronoarchaeum sp. GCM10025703 TaxID=3252685 RepID=UPI00360893BC
MVDRRGLAGRMASAYALAAGLLGIVFGVAYLGVAALPIDWLIPRSPPRRR